MFLLDFLSAFQQIPLNEESNIRPSIPTRACSNTPVSRSVFLLYH